MAFRPRTPQQLREKQRDGSLRVCTALEFRARVEATDLASAYAATDVLAAASCEFTDQGMVWISLGPSDPPLRLRQAQLGGVAASGGFGAAELCMPIGGGLNSPLRRGGAQVLDQLLRGEAVPLEVQGEGSQLHPRRDLQTTLQLERLGSGRLLLSRAITENGVVAVSSSEGLLSSPIGALQGPFSNALFSCSGARSIGLTMPGLAQLGPGQPVLVAGAIGRVLGPGSGHQPHCRRQASGQAKAPGATVAVGVELRDLNPHWIRPCFFEGHGAALLVAIAAPVLLLGERQARQAAVPDSALEAPVLDFSIPRRIRPGFGTVSYGELLAGRIQVDGHRLRAAPACSLHLGDSLAEDLLKALENGSFPITDHGPLDSSGRLHPLD